MGQRNIDTALSLFEKNLSLWKPQNLKIMNKRYFLLTAVIFLITMVSVQAQNIKNGNFENWTNVNAYHNPSGMQTFNLQSYFIKQSGNTTRDTNSHSGSYCARLETISNGNTSLAGLASIGFFDGDNGTGGIPFTQKPDTAYAWVKYNVLPGDTAAVGVIFKKMGTTYGIGVQFLTGAINGWTKIAMPIEYGISINPDSIIFIAASSISDPSTITGSVLYVDDISFSNGVTTIPNAGFESWVATTFEEPDDWFAYSYLNMYLPNPIVEKSTDAYSGTYAVKVTTQIIDNDTFGFFSNADIRDKWYNGQPVSANPYKLTGYYKYTPVGNDTAILGLQSNRWDATQNKEIMVEENMIKLAPTAIYAPFEVMMSYNQWPRIDSLQIAFTSSNLVNGQANVQPGSTLLIDSLNLLYYPVGIKENQNSNKLIRVFPNPASSQINFQFVGDLSNGEKTIIIFDALSKKVMELNTIQAELNSIDVSHLSSGIYFYIIESGNKIYQGKFSVR